MGFHSLLVVDDDADGRCYLTLLLGEKGYRVRAAANGLEGILAIESELPDLVLSDLKMPVMDGLELLLHVKARWPALPVLLLTVVDEVATVVEAVQRGASNYLVKPASPAAILAAVKRSLTDGRGTSSPPVRVPEILGSTRSMVEVRKMVTLAASCHVNVIITGETGTGKELVAQGHPPVLAPRLGSLRGPQLRGHPSRSLREPVLRPPPRGVHGGPGRPRGPPGAGRRGSPPPR